MKQAKQSFDQLIQTASDLYALYNRPEEALVYIERALLIEPRSTRALILKGDILFAIDRDEEALECYNRAVKIDPANAEAYSAKGEYYLGLEMPEKALPFFEKAYELHTPEDDWPSDLLYDSLAETLKQLGRVDEAIQILKEGLKENPGDDVLLDMLTQLEKEHQDRGKKQKGKRS